MTQQADDAQLARDQENVRLAQEAFERRQAAEEAARRAQQENK